MSLTRKEVDEIKPKVGRVVEKFLGFPEPVLTDAAVNCLSFGYDKKKTCEKLSDLLDSSKAEKLAEKVLTLVEGIRDKSSRKRHHEPENGDSKRSRGDDGKAKSAAELSASQIKDMMMNAQKMIEERKKALQTVKGSSSGGSAKSESSSAPSVPKLVSPALTSLKDDKARKIALLQAQIKNKLSSGVLGEGTFAPPSLIQPAPDKPTPLILDSEGRTVDSTGREVQLTHMVPTLKANIRAKKREEFKAQFQEKPNEESTEQKFFDFRISVKPNVRNKRQLKFNEPGKFQQLAERMRMKAQLTKLQGEISQIARKTGITSAAKLAQIAPKLDGGVDSIPKVEWWDSVILAGNDYGDNDDLPPIRAEVITNLVEHPAQMKVPHTKPIRMPVYLTKTERKKLRRQNRREAWKEEQEKIRLGLIAPPEPKLRISNLMRVLGTEAIQDPTKMEAHVKAQMAKRAKAHEEANQARKLTRAERRDKRRRKLEEDTTFGVHVSVYRVRDLSNITKKFKVEMNCKQLFMTGGVIMFKDCNVIVVEGGPKQQSKFKRLMLHRIKWEEDIVKNADGNDVPNECKLVWEGMVTSRNFGEIKFKVCATELLAREQLRKHGVEQYWDLAYSAAVLETEDK